MPIVLMAVKDAAPLIVGLIPFGITFGVLGSQAGLTSVETVLMSLIVFAGAAQFVGISMLVAGVSPAMIVFTTLLINLRHLLMSISMVPYLKDVGLKWQSLLAFGIIDESYAVVMKRFTQDGGDKYYQIAVNSMFYTGWATFTVVGVSVGQFIHDPLAWGLDFAMPATFIAIVIPQLVNRPKLAAAIVGSVVAVVAAYYVPGKWYIIIGAIVGMFTGGGIELWSGRKYYS